MASSENATGNTYGSDANYSNNNEQNLNETVERTARMKCTSEQGRSLAYLTIKHMVRTQGPHFHKGVSLGMNTWNAITRELNAMGIEKTPEQWRKCYSAAKYFAHMRFSRLMRDKQAVSGNPNVRPDWKEIEIRDLLYLQDWRSKGFPDMPEPDALMRAFENKQMFLHDYQQSASKLNFGYQREMFYDNNSFSNTFNDFTQFATLQPPIQLPQDTTLNHSELQIKCELEGAIDVDSPDDFHTQLQQMVEAHNRTEYASSRPRAHNSSPMPMPKPLPPPVMDLEIPTVSTSTKISNASRCRDSVESSEPNVQATADTGVGPECYYLERRLLEINEKLLKEKIKQNKILRKKNKILKQTRKEQKKQTDALNKLLEQLIRRV